MENMKESHIKRSLGREPPTTGTYPLTTSVGDNNHSIRSRKKIHQSSSSTIHYINPSNEGSVELTNTEQCHVKQASIPLLESPFLKDTKQFRSYSSSRLLNEGLVGLHNLGNSCYMNAVLQCIIHTKTFVTCFVDTKGEYLEHACDAGQMKGLVARRFADICSKIYQQEPFSVVNPSDIKELMGQVAHQFDGFEEHDAHEFLRIFLDTVNIRRCPIPGFHQLSEKQLQRMTAIQQGQYWWQSHLQHNSSAVTDKFCGQFRSTITCSICGDKTFCFDPFYDISIPIPSVAACRRRPGVALKRGKNSDADCSLFDCLCSFVQSEVLQYENARFCKICHGRHECTKLLTIEKLPLNLIIHLTRFDNSGKKKNTKVSFPLEDFNFEMFMSSDVKIDARYRLYSICQHEGSVNSGHYVSNCLDESNGFWYQYDDSEVSRIPSTVTTILSPSSSCYLLFYRRDDC